MLIRFEKYTSKKFTETGGRFRPRGGVIAILGVNAIFGDIGVIGIFGANGIFGLICGIFGGIDRFGDICISLFIDGGGGVGNIVCLNGDGGGIVISVGGLCVGGVDIIPNCGAFEFVGVIGGGVSNGIL
ncbi:hypothetical protein O3M35_003852 [Rhynocoris fuscipes]|uniref:Uncharacterized protein n=1 Tax=Rhynocoris fuscipes TaxID=488301 RepID=A0AAW1CHT7_9HEMI